MPQTYLAGHGEIALAVASAAERVLGRRLPPGRPRRPAIREAMLGLLRPGPAPGLYVLSDGAPFAHERV